MEAPRCANGVAFCESREVAGRAKRREERANTMMTVLVFEEVQLLRKVRGEMDLIKGSFV